ncbi:MAG: hypothetical protein CBC35_12330 [Planctomycetes bacterium TMED75]|nr:hypothetical protein [Planctomycetaceae bacterium]OUU90073.1 MAG: hypothetical protein CBC35_12330 [Planctomycetes bacterium TMED75]
MTIRPRRAIHTTASVCFAIACLIASSAHAQDVSSFARTTSPLSQAQQNTLEGFVSSGVQGLKDETSQSVVEARRRLIEPLTRAGTSAVFREAFGNLFVKQIKALLESDESLPVFNYANICQVLAFTRTGETNEFLASTLQPRAGDDSDATQSQGRALSAASMLVVSIQTTDPESIRPRQFNSIMRSVLMGAEQTSSWAVLQREFEALESIGSNPRVKEDIRKSAIENQMKLMQVTLDKIAEGRDMDLTRALSSMILKLRSQYIRLEGSIRRTFKSEVEPVLNEVLKTGAQSWDQLQSSKEVKELYGNSIEQAGVLIRLIQGGSTSGSGANLAEAWQSGDKSAYQSGIGN